MSHAEHRARLFEALPDSVAFLLGARQELRPGTDAEKPFRQDSNFLYLSGCDEPDCGLLLDSRYGVFILFVPRPSPGDEIWSGPPETREAKRDRYGATDVLYIDELSAALQNTSGRLVHLSEHVPCYGFPPDANTVFDLDPVIANLRLFKTSWEAEQMWRSCQISADAQTAVLTNFKPGMMEYQGAALYQGYVMACGATHLSFPTIFASGPNPATLHYTGRSRKSTLGELILIDSGCEINGYASDHSRTFPVGENFTERQAQLYGLVLRAQKECIELCRPGTSWMDVHLHALRVILEGLRNLGIVRADRDFQEQLMQGVSAVFMPHGIGHLIGLDDHDVGGYNPGEQRPDGPLFKYLRTNKVLAPMMAVTIEPGLYFVDGLLRSAAEDPALVQHINFDAVAQYRLEFAGCRIEDVILVTTDGPRVMPGAPKEIADICQLRSLAQ
ncbi:Xaa-Pro dipeptidase [Giardia muris]|uniref:Xaa-Pro dipeptidase n=1 Tax=Giardia muris TaxID=5742 RepID=A0A4Z1SSE3_GIAMU|nr:Xaa-Pro dipeptidase [Giardia muris]|eukprot:TNJ28816.1 Xaa-Pro dipeptidase [Giardia muris]